MEFHYIEAIQILMKINKKGFAEGNNTLYYIEGRFTVLSVTKMDSSEGGDKHDRG